MRYFLFYNDTILGILDSEKMKFSYTSDEIFNKHKIPHFPNFHNSKKEVMRFLKSRTNKKYKSISELINYATKFDSPIIIKKCRFKLKKTKRSITKEEAFIWLDEKLKNLNLKNYDELEVFADKTDDFALSSEIKLYLMATL